MRPVAFLLNFERGCVLMLDLLIKNGTIVDGTDKPSYKGDLAIADGKIVGIASEINEAATKVIEAEGMIVAPGFIDIHSHSDLCPFAKGLEPVSKLYQGITLEVVGNCGISALPVKESCRKSLSEYIVSDLQIPDKTLMLEDDSISDYAEHMKKLPAATNVGVLIGHGTLRGSVMGLDMRKPTPEELEEMKAVLDRELTRGAFGMSLGLIYPPSAYGELEELVELAKVLKKHEAILTVHMRSESTKIFEAVEEMLEVTRQSNVHLEISHLKLMGKPQWGRAEELLDKIKAAKAEGLDINCDQYPYLATSTGLGALAPHWAHSGGPSMLAKRTAEPTEQLLQEMAAELDRRGGADRVLVCSIDGKYREYSGMTLDAIAEKMGLDPIATACKLLSVSGGGVHCCYFTLSMEDMLAIMKEKFIAVGTDGYAYCYDRSYLGTNPHPRSFGTFPRYFQTVRENNLLPLESAIYKATALPADILGIKDRGRLLVGNKADVTVFDYNKITDLAEYTDSLKKPLGIAVVVIDGKVALENDQLPNGRFGQVVLHE